MIFGRRSRFGATALAFTLLAAACGGGESTAEEPDRPPLSSPPDPGPVPETDGLDPAFRERVVASTVAIGGIACGRTSTGSGFTIAEGLVATNAHVIVGVDEISVDTIDGRTLIGVAVAFDPDADLAVLEVAGLDLTPLGLGDAEDHTTGTLVGWESGPTPEPTPFRIDRPVTVRIESVGSDERIERPSWLVAADIDNGDSGAALIDGSGTVVGIAYATSRKASGVGYAVRATELDRLIADGFDDNLAIPDC